MSTTYADRWIECTPDALRIRGYYFPWGTKAIPYERIRGIRRVKLAALRGRWRIWGTGNPRYWASLDPGRPGKDTALILDLGGSVQPFLTPDDPDCVVAAIRTHVAIEVTAEEDGRGPFV